MKKLIAVLLICNNAIGQMPGILYTGTSGPPPFSPRDSAGLLRWYKADTLSLTLTNASPVSLWYDASGNTDDATQAISGMEPLFITGQINGRPIIRFDGGNTTYLNIPALSSTAPFTLFIVYKKTTSGQTFPTLGAADFSVYTWMDYSDGHAYTRTQAFSNYGDFTGDQTSFVTITQISSGGSDAVWKNGASQTNSGSSSSANPSVDFSYIGVRNTGPYAYGDMAELIFYDHAVTTQLRTDIEAYLRNKYAHY